MKTAQIIVTVDNDGNVVMEGIGFKGTACDKAMAAIEKSLGMQTGRKNKPEYDTAAHTTGQQKVGGQ